MIRKGYNAELDELHDIAENNNAWMQDFELRIKEETGIKNLKVGFNKVFGYYIEVSKGQVSQVPDSFIRKQTLVNGERYIVPELKPLKIRFSVPRKDTSSLNIISSMKSVTVSVMSLLQSRIRPVPLVSLMPSILLPWLPSREIMSARVSATKVKSSSRMGAILSWKNSSNGSFLFPTMSI